MELEGHCHRSGCICTHSQPCEYGWIWVEYYDEVKVKINGKIRVTSERRSGVVPCPTCDPEKARIVRESKNTTEMGEKLRARSAHNRRLAYEEAEGSKTRTL